MSHFIPPPPQHQITQTTFSVTNHVHIIQNYAFSPMFRLLPITTSVTYYIVERPRKNDIRQVLIYHLNNPLFLLINSLQIRAIIPLLVLFSLLILAPFGCSTTPHSFEKHSMSCVYIKYGMSCCFFSYPEIL